MNILYVYIYIYMYVYRGYSLPTCALEGEATDQASDIYMYIRLYIIEQDGKRSAPIVF